MAKEMYSSGLVSHSFWFLEFKQLVFMRRDGMAYDEIKKKCIEENILGVAKAYRAQRMAGYLMNRLKTLDDALIGIFCDGDLATQKLITLIAILRSDRLYFEFLYEVYREKSMLGVKTLEDADVNAFFTLKEQQSELVAKWEDVTRKRLRSSYFNFLIDAGLLTVINKERTITPAILDYKLELYLQNNENEAMLKALTGVM